LAGIEKKIYLLLSSYVTDKNRKKSKYFPKENVPLYRKREKIVLMARNRLQGPKIFDNLFKIFRKEENGMKTIKLYLQIPIKVYVLFSLALISLVGFWMMILYLKEGGLNHIPVLIVSLSLLFITIWWVGLVTRIPHTIHFRDDKVCEFLSKARKTEVAPAEILSIRPWAGGVGFFTLRHRKGKLILLNQFDGFHEWIHLIKKENADIELRGC
jgi:hypothetical protein